ncbi:MAG: AAA family ATPase [Deltaproteobacteria bacterium]|nr:AAA family ATPase [Deltaproteobacteria bacterium]
MGKRFDKPDSEIRKKMAERIVSTGRGGTGKSTFVALASRYLRPPMLLVDLDPDESLADMLGFDLEKQGISTISDKLYDILEAAKRGRPGPVSALERMSSIIKKDCLYRKNDTMDLIVLGTKLTKGCYCTPDDILKAVIPKMADRYSSVVIDSPAGLEHLNRKVFSEVDDFFIILDPSSKSLQHVGRVKDITRELKIEYENFYLLANYRFDQGSQEYLESSSETFLGKIESDPSVEEHNLIGKSLLELPEDSPACISVKELLEKVKLLNSGRGKRPL